MGDSVDTPRAAPDDHSRSFALTLLVVLAAAAGSFHLLAMVQHFAESVAYGVFFAVVAVCQLTWAAWLYRRPQAAGPTLAPGAVANLAVVAVWAISRISGVPVGPEAGEPEAVSLIDVLATLDELAIAALVVAILRPAGSWGSRLAALTPDQQTRSYLVLVSATVFGLLLGSAPH